MMPDVQPSPVEWRDDAQPFAICMICNSEFPATETVCPKCKVTVSKVHRCPRCTRVVSVKHTRCPYCSKTFLKNDELEDGNPGAAAAPVGDIDNLYHRPGKRTLLLFCVAVFLLVFIAASVLINYHSGQKILSGPLGSSYAVDDSLIRGSMSLQAAPVNHLTTGTVVEISGVSKDDNGRDWFAVTHDDVSGFVQVNDLAPPKGRSADGGYLLLKTSLTDLQNPAELGDATKAVDLYRQAYLSDSRGEELLWLLAEKSRELGIREHSHAAMAVASKTLSELVKFRGHYAAQAQAALSKMPDFPSAPPPVSDGPAPIEIMGDTGTAHWDAYQQSATPHRLMLLSHAEVLVRLPLSQQVHPGDLLVGHVARDVNSNGERVVPANSACTIRVESVGASGGVMTLQMESMQIQNQNYSVESNPVERRVGQPNGPVVFQLRKALILSR